MKETEISWEASGPERKMMDLVRSLASWGVDGQCLAGN